MNEKYIPLYRKYRPQTLEQIVGQDHVKKALSNALELNKIAHAYLFTGSRGTGKTSSARILAKSLNCENGPTVKPCGKCSSCLDIANSTPVDVIEIDAASNRKVEDAQNILEKVQYVPINGKYKIYIIDEVHMLTNHAFNALLKTLEEPPENVIFILATTEPHKVLDTIKSRCQRFDFKRISAEDITNHLEYIAKQENINIEKEALFTIAKNSEGGMRDSIALLDQLSVLGITHTITVNDINSLLGRISFDSLTEITKTILENNPQNAIQILEKIYNAGNEPSQILANMLEYFKNTLLVKTCNDKIVLELTQYNEKQIEEIKPFAQELETHQIINLIEKISTYIREIKITTTPHLWLEVALIDLANLTENTKLSELQNRLIKLESGITEQTTSNFTYKTAPAPTMKPSMKPASATAQKQEVKPKVEQENIETEIIETKIQKEVQKEFEPEPIPMSKPKQAPNSNDLHELWKNILLNISNPATQSMLKHVNPVEITPERVIIACPTEPYLSKFNKYPRKKEHLTEACDKLFNQKNTNVIIRIAQPEDAKIINSQQKKNNNSGKISGHILQEKPLIPAKAETTNNNIRYDNVPPSSDITEKLDKHISSDSTEQNKDISKITMYSDQMNMIMRLFDGKVID